jgi:branched-chain amino acid transport system substrate-binding protein
MRPFAVFVAALILLTAVARSSGAAAEVLIGVGAPLSGRQAELGAAIRRGAERSVAAINASGGLLGEHLVLAVEDDACESAKGAESAKALTERRPAVVIGHPCAGAATRAAEVYAGERIVFIATGVRNPSLTHPRAGPSVFRLAGRDDRQGEAAADWLARMAPGRRIVIVDDRTKYGRGIAQAAAERLKREGVVPLPGIGIVGGQKDYGAVARSLAGADAEAILIAGFPAEARLILQALRAQGSTVRFLGSDALAAADFQDVSAGDRERVRVLVPWTLPVPASWREDALKAGETEASVPAAALAYAAIEAWAGAVRRANSFAAEAVEAVLGQPTATSALGDISFDENGDARVPSFAPAVWDGTSWDARD